MSAGPNNVMVPYEVEIGSDGNIMPYTYIKKFPQITNEQLATTKKQ